MITRREALAGGALSIFFIGNSTCGCSANSTAPHSEGCILADSDLDAVYPDGSKKFAYPHGDEPMFSRSGNSPFDFALAQTLAKISNLLKVQPDFCYYDDSAGKNAYATQRVRMSRTDGVIVDGTVLMGINFLRDSMKLKESPEVVIAGVCAHEFGHIVQFKHDLMHVVNAGQKTSKRCELQADYFAGYFSGSRKLEKSDYPAAVVAMAQYNWGDTNDDWGHHGTPSERGLAVTRGFEAAFHQKLTLNDAIEQSTNYVLSL